jgi:hypothetical protein
VTTTMLTPMDRGKARPSGASLWRKQVLPLGTIDYKGRKITFSREYLAGLVKAFADKAYDVVPFQFADAANSHSNAPEQRRGTVRDLELTDDGLDIIVEAGQDAAKHLAEYPDLGVSARIVEGYDRADGKFFPAAIQHVLGTLDPRITGLRPWQAIDAANDDGDVLDLTGEQYTPTSATVTNAPGTPGPVQQQTPTGTPTEEHTMAFTPDQEARLAKLLDLPDDKFDAMLATAEAEPAAEDELSDEELQALIASLPDDNSEAEPTDDSTEDEAEDAVATDEKVPVGASLTAEAQAAIDLANSRAEETSLELARVTTALNRAAYEKERDHYSREYGIPPRITDLARPVLEGEGHVVDLANGSSVDAGAIVRKLLKEIGQTVKMLDLSGEMGSPLDGGRDAERAAEEQAAKDRHDMVGRVRAMTGI